jgi:hypothetical protein
VPLIRPFVQDAARFARSYDYSPAIRKGPSRGLVASLKWVSYIMSVSSRMVPIRRADPIDLDWYGDASISFGVGVCVAGFYSTWRWRQEGLALARQYHDEDINWAEAIIVELGLLLVLDLMNAGQLDIGSAGNLLFYSDNSSVCAVTMTGKARNESTRLVLQRIYAHLAERHLYLTSAFVPTNANIADSLSRGDLSEFRRWRPDARRWQVPLPGPFASYLFVS